MKKIIIIPLLLFTLSVFATKYYVSPSGTDGAYPTRGTIGSPWKSWNYAFNNVTPSDTVYFRGGVYTELYSTSRGAVIATTAISGTRSAPTCFFAYPDETPIFDCWGITNPTYENYGILISRASNLYFKGLVLRNVPQIDVSTIAYGWTIWSEGSTTGYATNNIRLENCIAHNIGGCGFAISTVDTINVINCDSYNNCDTLTAEAGGTGAGFQIAGSNSYVNINSSYVYLKGTRAWMNSDQGYAYNSASKTVFDSCWSVNNGNFGALNESVKGSGWKIWIYSSGIKNTSLTQLTIRNCIAVDNNMSGFNFTDEPRAIRLHLYNNFSYRNGKLHAPGGSTTGTGFYNDVSAYTDTTGLWDHRYWNNISYDNTGWYEWHESYPQGDFIKGIENQLTNKWDSTTTTITDADFASLDTTGLCGVRQGDGSLPVTTFGHLVLSSECIDAGTDVGLPFGGTAPDIGWAEYDLDETATDILTFTLADQTGAATINATNHTIAIEVDYTADITALTPTITLSYGATIIPASGVARNFTSPLPYTVTALDGVTYQEWTVTVTQEEEPEEPPVASTGQIVKFNGKIVKR